MGMETKATPSCDGLGPSHKDTILTSADLRVWIARCYPNQIFTKYPTWITYFLFFTYFYPLPIFYLFFTYEFTYSSLWHN